MPVSTFRSQWAQDLMPCDFSYSHGESVLHSELRDNYIEPDFTLLNRSRHPVLAKQSDNIWHKGRAISCNFAEKTCQVKLEMNRKVVECDFTDVLPLQPESLSDSEEELSDDGQDYEAMHRAQLVEKSLLTPALDQPLGEWEKHTKVFVRWKCLRRDYSSRFYIPGIRLENNAKARIRPWNGSRTEW